LKIVKVGQIFGPCFFHGESYVLILTKMGWATFWAIFSTSSSGHPELDIHRSEFSFAPQKIVCEASTIGTFCLR
jgi:hypothetical protein